MARPLWQGQIQISLVSLGVSVFPASNTARAITFHQIDRASGERVHRRAVAPAANPSAASSDSEAAEEPVEAADIAKGYEYEKGKYVIIEPDELKKLRLPGQKSFDIVQFVGAAEIDPAFFEKPYFVVPKDELQAKSMAIIRRAMRDTGSVGLGEITFSGREHLAALSAPADPEAQGLRLYLMRYEEELRKPEEYYENVKAVGAVDEKQLSMAKELIQHYRAPFEAGKFRDDYEAAVRALVEAKLEHKPLPKEEPERQTGKVINLMDALKLSLARRQRESGGAIETAPSTQEEKPAKGRKPKSASARPHKVA